MEDMLHLVDVPSGLKSEPEDVMTSEVIAEMRSYISGDPYDRKNSGNIYTAMRLQFWREGVPHTRDV